MHKKHKKRAITIEVPEAAFVEIRLQAASQNKSPEEAAAIILAGRFHHPRTDMPGCRPSPADICGDTEDLIASALRDWGPHATEGLLA